MARARYRGTFDTLAAGAPQYFSVVPNAIVTAYEAGTTTPIAQTIYAARTGGTTLPNPMTADADGSLEFFLDEPQDVKLEADGSGSGLGTITVDWEPVPPTVSDTATFSRVGAFTAQQTFGTGGWPADYDSPSSYEPVKTPVNAAFVDGSTAAPSTTVAPAVSFSRITAGDWIGEGAGNTYLIGHFNITAERGGNGTLNPLTTKINHDVLIVKGLQTTPANMQAVTGIVVQDATRGTAPFHTDDATTKADAQKNISGFAAFFLADSWDPLFESIGGEVNVLSDYGTTDASPDYYTADGSGTGQAPWVDSLSVTQPYQPGRHIGWSIIGKGWAGHTAGLIIGADPYATDGSHTATANAGRWATAIDIQPDSIWSSTKRAIRVPNDRKYVSRKAASGEIPLLYLGTTDTTVLNTASGSPGLLYVNDATEAARWQSTGLRLPNANKLFSVTTGAAETPLLYMNASNHTILNAATGQEARVYVNDTTLIAQFASGAATVTGTLTATGATTANSVNVNTTGAAAGEVKTSSHIKAGGRIYPAGQTAKYLTMVASQAVAAGATVNLGAVLGLYGFFDEDTDGAPSLVWLRGSGAAATSISTPDTAAWSINSDAGSRWAVYWSTNAYFVKNRAATSKSFSYTILTSN